MQESFSSRFPNSILSDRSEPISCESFLAKLLSYHCKKLRVSYRFGWNFPKGHHLSRTADPSDAFLKLKTKAMRIFDEGTPAPRPIKGKGTWSCGLLREEKGNQEVPITQRFYAPAPSPPAATDTATIIPVELCTLEKREIVELRRRRRRKRKCKHQKPIFQVYHWRLVRSHWVPRGSSLVAELLLLWIIKVVSSN